MSKKVAVILVILALGLVGGYFVYRAIADQQAKATYEQSPDKIADDFNRYLLSNDLKDTSALFTADLQSGYSQTFWQSHLFDLFKNYHGSVTQLSKGPANQSGQPAAYPQSADARKYVYGFTLNGVAYHVTMVFVRQDGSWRINELNGAYQQ